MTDESDGGGVGTVADHETLSDTATQIWSQQQEILKRVALGGDRAAILSDIVRVAEGQTEDEMLASILLLSDDGKSLLLGGAPSLPDDYNQAIHGMEIGPGEGSCGTAAATGEPVYVENIATDPLWADFRDLAGAHGLASCWSVPIKTGSGKVLGTFANYYRSPRQPSSQDREIIEAVALTTAIAIEHIRLEEARDRAELAKRVVLEELQHRVKNAYTLAQSLINLNVKSASSAQDLAGKVTDKLRAIAASQDLIVIRDPSGPAVEDLDLSALLERILEPLAFEEGSERIAMSGDKVPVNPAWLSSMAMVFHELATNSTKYGALGDPEGRVSIRWEVREDLLEILWEEMGGPETSAPDKTSFGSRLVGACIKQLGGQIDHDWRPEGLQVRMTLPHK